MRLRALFFAAWPLALVGWVFERTGRLGFTLIDEGFIASYANRVLHGQIPHRDFISPRPAGSALLHAPELLLPFPLFEMERVIGTAEVVLLSTLVGWLVFDRPPWRWGVGHAGAVATAALVNLNTFLETPWPTFDGLVLAAAAAVLLREALRRNALMPALVAIAIAGAAPITKQSFVPAPFLLLAAFCWTQRHMPPRAFALRVVAGVAAALAPAFVYFGVIDAAGGLGDAVGQLTGGRFVWGRAILGAIGIDGPALYGVRTLTVSVGLAALALAYARTRAASRGLVVPLAAVLTLLVLGAVFSQHLRALPTWSLELWWALFAVVAVRALVERRVDWVAGFVLAMGWMASLSRTSPNPILVAGSLALAAVWWGFAGTSRRDDGRGVASISVAYALCALLVLAYTSAHFVRAREASPSFDLPAHELDADISSVGFAFHGLRTNNAMAEYLRQLKACVRRYPADRDAVLPEGEGMSVALGLHNPLPVDYLVPEDIAGQWGRIVAAARRVDRDGDYLMLFQTVSGFSFRTLRTLPRATVHSKTELDRGGGFYDVALGRRLMHAFHGTRIACGSLVGIWSPASG